MSIEEIEMSKRAMGGPLPGEAKERRPRDTASDPVTKIISRKIDLVLKANLAGCSGPSAARTDHGEFR